MTSKKSIKTDERQRVTDDAIFKVAKEVAIKFIEVGRLSPDSFPERFETIYAAIKSTVRKNDSE